MITLSVLKTKMSFAEMSNKQLTDWSIMLNETSQQGVR